MDPISYKTGSLRINVKLQRVCVTIDSMEEQKLLHILSVCVCVRALVTQYAKRMCCIILSSVACLALQHISTFYHKRHDFFFFLKY